MLYSGLPLTRALEGLFIWFKPAFWWTSINCYYGYSRVGLERILSLSQAPGRICRRLSRFCNILLQDMTPLHVMIMRSSNLLSVCHKKFKLSTYLHTVSYNHVSFLNTPSQLVWVLASSGFYSITWRMISRSAGYKIHFRTQPPFRGIFFSSRCDTCIFRFFEFILLGNSSTAPVFSYNQINKQRENLYVNYRERFSYFTQLAETSLF